MIGNLESKFSPNACEIKITKFAQVFNSQDLKVLILEHWKHRYIMFKVYFCEGGE